MKRHAAGLASDQNILPPFIKDGPSMQIENKKVKELLLSFRLGKGNKLEKVSLRAF